MSESEKSATFHVRGWRYFREFRDDEEFDTLEEAVEEARYQFEQNLSAQQAIWSGEECVMDHAEFMKVV